MFLFYGYGDHRDLHVPTHPFPTRRSSDLRIVNFSAGPATLPLEVLQQVQSELLDWQGCGMSVMEMSHRGKEFISIAQQAEADLREVAGIPANYKVLFMQGGANGQFTFVPMNLLRGKQSIDFVLTGEDRKSVGWGKRVAGSVGRGG